MATLFRMEMCMARCGCPSVSLFYRSTDSALFLRVYTARRGLGHLGDTQQEQTK